MRGLIFRPSHRQPGKRADAAEFRREAERFAALHGIPGQDIVPIDTRPGTNPRMRLSEAISHLATRADGGERLAIVAFFCHGTARHLQLGGHIRHVGLLAQAVAACSRQNVVMPLYACDAGSGGSSGAPGGELSYAYQLRDALCQAGLPHCRVDAHTTRGHTTRNPFVIRFEGLGSPVGGSGGQRLVQKGGPVWHAWVAALRETDMRFRYPLLDPGHIAAELSGKPWCPAER